MYVSIKPPWYTSRGRIEKHTTDEKGKPVKEYIGATLKEEDADRIVALLNYTEKEDNDS